MIGLILLIGGAFGLLLVSLALWAYESLTGKQFVIIPDRAGVRFPTVIGSNLSGNEYVLPGDIEGEVALMMIAFQQFQQAEVDTWVPLARRLAERHPNFAYYELPTIRRLIAPARAFIDGGMRAGIPDQTARNTTVTLYLDKDAFREALQIPDEETITIMLVDAEGNILWRARGPASAETERELVEAVEEALGG
jgi:hypothetical protein